MKRIVLTLLLALLVAPALHAANRYDPRLRFRTLTTPRFDIHFHQGGETLARRLAGIVELVAAELEPRLGTPRARVNVILVDQADISNGWATPLPYNLIEIVAATPRAESTIGNTTDWLRLVFTHEYVHVIHLERSRGLLGAVGRVFGRHPFFYPNLFLPPWQIEGLATYEESALTGQGRVNAGDFRLVLTHAAAVGRFHPLDRASNAIVQWPGGHTPYLYGAFFHEYLANTYGEAKLEELANSTAARLPFFGSRAFKRVYGKSLGALWNEFARTTASRADPGGAAPRRLTHHGFDVSDPWFLPDGRLLYSVANPHGFPSLMSWSEGTGPVSLTTRAGGEQISATDGTVVFDQVEYVRSVALQSDLYAFDTTDGRVRRLTREARAADVDVSSDGTQIVCTVQTIDGRAIATAPMPRGEAAATLRVLVTEPGGDFASPRWSPDGGAIAADRRRTGGASEIVILDPATGVVRQVVTSSRRGRNTSPVWSRDGRTLLFASDREGGAFRIYAADLAAGTLRRLEGTGPSAHSPALSPDGATLVFVGYTGDGYDLFSLPLAEARWEEVANEVPAPAPSSPDTSSPATADASSPYSPVATLLPRFWTPVLEDDDDGTAIGASTAGADALGRHSYAVSAAWSTRGRPDWSAAYAYDRWRPTLFVDVSDDEDPWRSGHVRTREVNAGAVVAFRRVRRTQTVIGSYHAARERLDCVSCEPSVFGEADRRAIRGGWVYDSSRRYGYSISDEEGFTASLFTEWTAAALGADGDARALVADVRGYRRAGPRHAVLAARLAAARGWGDEPVRRVFAVGSSAAAVPWLDFGVDAIALVRGFDAADLNGRTAVVGNLDYRVPLVWIERGRGTWPVFLRSLHGAVFTDVGTAWDDARTRNDLRASFGAELSGDLVVGYALPVTISGGAAMRHDPTRRSHGLTVFARVGRAF